MAVRYDACVIGADADGMAAATVLARAGLKTIIVERLDRTGGRLHTREFHPGYRASPYLDILPSILPDVFWSFDLARRGLLVRSRFASCAVWPDRDDWASSTDLDRPVAEFRRQVFEQALRQAQMPPPRGFFRFWSTAPVSWPKWADADSSLAELTQSLGRLPDRQAHMASLATISRSVDPFHAGSAIQLWAPAASGCLVVGGTRPLALALEAAAREAGVDISLGLEATDIRNRENSVAGVCLADGSEIEAVAVVSTLDLKRTFLTLFKWNELEFSLAQKVSRFRMDGGVARLLLALERSGASVQEHAAQLLFVAPSLSDMAEAHQACRSGVVPARPPLSIHFPSSLDPSLAPSDGVVATLTLGAIPLRLFDGAWTHERRANLVEQTLSRIEQVIPGVRARLRGWQLIAPPEFDEQLGHTDGDLWGGEIAPDQMLQGRPGLGSPGPRTPVNGLYLAGPSSVLGPIATCSSGIVAAAALLADRAAGRFA